MEEKNSLKQLLGKCPEHKKKFSLICVSPICSKKDPRLFCTNCSVLYHKNCNGKFILLEDIEKQKYDNDLLKEWIPQKDLRKYLDDNREILEEYNRDASIQKLSKSIDDIFERLILQCTERLNQMRSEFRDKVVKNFENNEFRQIFPKHFSFETLYNILRLNKDNKDALNKGLEDFFIIKKDLNCFNFPNFDLNEKNLENLLESLADEFKRSLHKLNIFQEKLQNEVEVVNRFSKSQTQLGWGYGGKCPDAIDFKTNIDKLLRGVGIYTGDHTKGKESRTADIKVYEENKEILRRTFIFENKDQKIFSYYLDVPIFVKAEGKYTVSVFVQGSHTYYATNSGTPTINFKTKGSINFFNSSMSQNGTEIGCGQIPELYFDE